MSVVNTELSLKVKGAMLLKKEGRSIRKGGGGPTLEETMYSEDFRRPLSCFLTLCAALKGDVSPDKQNYFNITLEIAIFVLA